MHEETRNNNVMTHETNAARYYWTKISADAVDAKSCKAEETKEQIRMETIDRDKVIADECKRYVGNTRTQINAFKTKKAIKK